MFRIVETPGSWRLILPQRRPLDLPREWAGAGCAVVLLLGTSLLGLPWLDALGKAAHDFNADTFGSLVLLLPFGSMGVYSLVLILWILAGGRSEFRMTARRLRLVERVGPLIFMVRSLPLDRVSGFRAHPYDNGRGCLTFEVVGGVQRRWSVEYPMAVLEAAAQELARRRDALLQGPGRGPADVEHGADALWVKVPAVGWRLPYALPMAVLVGLGLAMIWGGLALKIPPWPMIGGLCLLAVLGVAGYRNTTRTYRLELSDASLRIVSRDFLRTRTQEWGRRDVWGYEVETPHDSGGAELRVRLRSGAKPLLLAGRDLEELEWIASVLRRGRLKQDVQVTSTTTAARGTCQVCGDPMEERIVWCRKCRTPHHRECWIYTGMCATFGCREIGHTDT